MPYQVVYNEKDHCVECRVLDSFDMSIPNAMLPEIASLILQENCFRILLDFRKAKMGLSTLDIYQLPEKLAAGLGKAGIEIVKLRRAFLVSKEEKGFEFLETVTLNQHQTGKLFHDKAEAIKWLKE